MKKSSILITRHEDINGDHCKRKEKKNSFYLTHTSVHIYVGETSGR